MLRPLNGNVFIRRLDRESVSPGGIVLTSSKKQADRGEVVAVGDGQSVQIGDRVVFDANAAQPTRYQGQDLVVVADEDVLAVITGH